MLRPLRPTDYRLNSCLIHTEEKRKASPRKSKKVLFTKEAMDAAEEQAKRAAERPPRTPTKMEEPEIKIIGSSCTWGDEELDRFKVKIVQDVDVREMIPSEFFDFEKFEGYDKCKAELCALSKEDLTSDEEISTIENASLQVFSTLQEVLALQPKLRLDNLSAKRKQTKTQLTQTEATQVSSTVDVDDDSPPVSVEVSQSTLVSQTASQVSIASSSRRIVSGASIADPEQDSAGGTRVLVSNEKSSDMFANTLLDYVRRRIWPRGIILDWVQGRTGKTTLMWHHTAQEANLKLGGQRVRARTDGNLQIEVADAKTNGRMLWPRSYYVLPLEAKRFNVEMTKDRKTTKREVTNPENPVFAGQIFAEMLAGVCHGEYYRYSDQEAFAIFIMHTSFQLYHAKLPMEYLQTVYDEGSILNENGVFLSATRMYDFCEPADRVLWLDILIALIEYLRSGESYVGALNNRLPKNMLHGGNPGDDMQNLAISDALTDVENTAEGQVKQSTMDKRKRDDESEEGINRRKARTA